MNKARHACFKLGNNQKESLENCDLFDSIKSDASGVKEILLIINLVEKCKSDKNIKYVERLLNLKLKPPTADKKKENE